MKVVVLETQKQGTLYYLKTTLHESINFNLLPIIYIKRVCARRNFLCDGKEPLILLRVQPKIYDHLISNFNDNELDNT